MHLFANRFGKSTLLADNLSMLGLQFVLPPSGQMSVSSC